MTDRLRTDLTATFSLRAVSRAALGCLLGAALLAPVTPARAGDDDNVPVDTKIFRGILEGIGLRRDGEAINYEERAPLVIPPSHALPPPERSNAAIAKNPAWPIDPDVQRRKLEAKQARSVSMNPDETLRNEQRPMTEGQMTPGPKPRAARRVDDGVRPSAYGSSGALSPSQLDTKPGFWSKMFGKEDTSETGRFTGEPPRAALTEPPPGYQTPSPDQPYGAGKEVAAPKATNYRETHGTVDGSNTN
jgi:hypothetical protein